MNQPTLTIHAHQRGAVLVVALLLLLVLTIIGITGLSNMTMEERMAAGYQQWEIAFQGSESAVRDIIAKTNTSVPTDPLVIAMNTCQTDIAQPSINMDPADQVPGADVNAAVSVNYQGEGLPPPGYDYSLFKGQNFNLDVSTDVSVAGNTVANAAELQGVVVVAPAGAGTGCTFTAATVPDLPVEP